MKGLRKSLKLWVSLLAIFLLLIPCLTIVQAAEQQKKVAASSDEWYREWEKQKETDPLLKEWYDLIGFKPKPDIEWEKKWVGKKIDASNVDEVKDMLPEIAYLAFKNWKNVFAYVEPATYNWRPCEGFIKVTKENMNAATCDEKYPYEMRNFIGGTPFPQPGNDPIKIAWNRDRGTYEGDDMNLRGIRFEVVDPKGRGRSVDVDYNRLRWAYRSYRDPRPELPGNTAGIYRTTALRVFAPFDLAGLNMLVVKYKDTSKEEDLYLYVPTMRRVRRMSAGQRCDSLAGTDAAWDDSDNYDGEVRQNDYKYLGIQDKLVWYDISYPYPETADWAGPYLSGLPFQRRPMIIIEATSNIPNFCYKKRIWWIDPISFKLYNSTMYDQKGRLWKEQYIAVTKSMKDPKNPLNIPAAMTQFIDWIAQHASPWHYLPPEKGQKNGPNQNVGWDPGIFTPEGLKKMGH
jgi:hypothetical protein